jgi:hypothetical protein
VVRATTAERHHPESAGRPFALGQALVGRFHQIRPKPDSPIEGLDCVQGGAKCRSRYVFCFRTRRARRRASAFMPSLIKPPISARSGAWPSGPFRESSSGTLFTQVGISHPIGQKPSKLKSSS